MNFRIKKNVFLFFFSLMYFSLMAQENVAIEKYFIRNYLPKEYGAHVQSRCAAQDYRGVIYIANGYGVLEYDGINWKLIQLPSKKSVRSIAVDSLGRIYVGGEGEFGFFEPSGIGDWVYVSLSDFLADGQKKFATIKDILVVEGSIYFREGKHVFCYKSSGTKVQPEDLKVWKTEKLFYKLFNYNSQLYAYVMNYGLTVLEKDTFVLAKDGEKFKSDRILFALQVDEETLLLGNNINNAFYYRPDREKTIEKAAFKTNTIADAKSVWHVNLLDTNEILFSIPGYGVYIFDKSGRLVSIIDEESGLNNLSIHNILKDREGNIWLLTDKGITKIEISLPIQFLDEKSGIVGMPRDMIRHKGVLYIATNSGILYREGNTIKKILPYDGPAWSFCNFIDPETPANNMLLVALGAGVYELRKHTWYRFLQRQPGYPAYKLAKSVLYPNRVYVGYYSGVGVLEYIRGKWVDIGWMKGVTENIRSIQEMPNGEIWLGTLNDGVIRIISSGNILEPDKIIKYSEEDGLPSLRNIFVHRMNDSMVFATEQGLYKFIEDREVFEPITELKDDSSNTLKDVRVFFQQKNGNVWLAGLNNRISEIGVGQKQQEGNYQWNPVPFYRIPEMEVAAFYPDKDSAVWIVGSEGLFKYKQRKTPVLRQSFPTIIRKIELGSDSVIFKGVFYEQNENGKKVLMHQPLNMVPTFSYKNNSIKFCYGALSYFKEDENNYQYYLEGYDKNWSKPDHLTHKEYTNLSEGVYRFHVKAFNIYKAKGEETVYEFEILAPWYRTWLAYLLYFLFAIIVIALIVRLNNKRLRRLNIRLEGIIEDRTEEIIKQKEEILAQNEEILQANEEILAQRDSIEEKNKILEKLSVVASETDNSVVIMNPQGEFEWANKAFTKLFGYSLEEYKKQKGNSIQEITNVEGIDKFLDKCKTEKRSVIYDSVITNREGKQVWLQTTLTPIFDYEGKLVKLVAIDADISRIKELEYHRDLLTQMIVHDLKNPLNSVIGFSSLASNEKRNQIINQAGRQMLYMVENILDVQKFEEQRMELNMEKHNINLIAEKSISNLIFLLFENSIEILNHTEMTHAIFDQEIIKRVLVNFLTNAIKYSPEGGIIIISSHKQIINDKGYIKVEVCDQGEGIPADMVDKIFDKYAQAVAKKSGRARSTGLGLTFCKLAIEAHGGIIGVESQEGVGSSFFFLLPEASKEV